MLKGNRYLHFVYSYRTNRNISDSITVFNVKNQNMNNDGNSHVPVSCLCIQGEALTIKRQWKREMKPIKQKVNVWLLIDALAFIIISDEFIMEAFCKHALMNSGKQLPLMHLRFSSTDDLDVSSSVWTRGAEYLLFMPYCEKDMMQNDQIYLYGSEKNIYFWPFFFFFCNSTTGNITNTDFREKKKNQNIFSPNLFWSFFFFF